MAFKSSEQDEKLIATMILLSTQTIDFLIDFIMLLIFKFYFAFFVLWCKDTMVSGLIPNFLLYYEVSACDTRTLLRQTEGEGSKSVAKGIKIRLCCFRLAKAETLYDTGVLFFWVYEDIVIEDVVPIIRK
jgi:hypothetical protein